MAKEKLLQQVSLDWTAFKIQAGSERVPEDDYRTLMTSRHITAGLKTDIDR